MSTIIHTSTLGVALYGFRGSSVICVVMLGVGLPELFRMLPLLLFTFHTRGRSVTLRYARRRFLNGVFLVASRRSPTPLGCVTTGVTVLGVGIPNVVSDRIPSLICA